MWPNMYVQSLFCMRFDGDDVLSFEPDRHRQVGSAAGSTALCTKLLFDRPSLTRDCPRWQVVLLLFAVAVAVAVAVAGAMAVDIAVDVVLLCVAIKLLNPR